MAWRLQYIWVWKFDGDRAFVFIGTRMSPSKRWRRRYEFESELHDVLRALDRKPKSKPLLAAPVFGTEARAIKTGVDEKLQAEGYKLLSSRDRSTIKAGHKPPRAVFVTTGWGNQWFPSIRAAAKALGVHYSTVFLAAADPDRLDYFFDHAPEKKR